MIVSVKMEKDVIIKLQSYRKITVNEFRLHINIYILWNVRVAIFPTTGSVNLKLITKRITFVWAEANLCSHFNCNSFLKRCVKANVDWNSEKNFGVLKNCTHLPTKSQSFTSYIEAGPINQDFSLSVSFVGSQSKGEFSKVKPKK